MQNPRGPCCHCGRASPAVINTKLFAFTFTSHNNEQCLARPMLPLRSRITCEQSFVVCVVNLRIQSTLVCDAACGTHTVLNRLWCARAHSVKLTSPAHVQSSSHHNSYLCEGHISCTAHVVLQVLPAGRDGQTTHDDPVCVCVHN